MIDGLRGFVVAGGRSSRMGRDKALLPIEGATLLDHALARLGSVGSDVRILCGPEKRYQDRGVPVVEDLVCGAGPIGGLYSALVSSAADGRPRTLWLAVDVPLVPISLLRRLASDLDRADVAIARTTEGFEPLCAAFRTEPALEAVRRALLAGHLKITRALESLALVAVDAPAPWFANINSPSDYETLAALSVNEDGEPLG